MFDPVAQSVEDLPRRWRPTAERLNLAPNQHQEPAFKAILGNCQSVVNRLAAIRTSAIDDGELLTKATLDRPPLDIGGARASGATPVP